MKRELGEVYKGEHFVVRDGPGDTLYRKLEEGYAVVIGVDENPSEDTNVTVVNPWMWFASYMTETQWI